MALVGSIPPAQPLQQARVRSCCFRGERRLFQSAEPKVSSHRRLWSSATLVAVLQLRHYGAAGEKDRHRARCQRQASAQQLSRRAIVAQPPLSLGVLTATSIASASTKPSLPGIGLGTCCLTGEDCERQVKDGLLQGFRLLDTASHYDNEEAVAQAVRSAGLLRSDVFLVTKVWFDDMGDMAREAIEASLERLGTDYVDLLLMHFPGANDALQSPARNKRKRQATWEAMEAALQSGMAKDIGVANFTRRHIKEILTYASRPPTFNQIELHPYFQQQELVDFCLASGIQPMAFSPLAHGELNLLADPLLKEIAANHGRTPAQVALRWHVQRGITPIVFSTSSRRLAENFAAADGSFSLSPAEMSKISFLDRLDGRVGYDPSRIA